MQGRGDLFRVGDAHHRSPRDGTGAATMNRFLRITVWLVPLTVALASCVGKHSPPRLAAVGLVVASRTPAKSD